MADSETVERLTDLFQVLVVGDWVVDDHWVTAVHRSPTASRTGRAHYRSLHRPSGSVRALCGAGRTASVLHQSTRDGAPFCDVIGIGVWHRSDTLELTAMLDSSRNKAVTPFRLTRSDPEVSRNSGSTLCNLADVLPEKDPETGSPLEYGTSRMIRTYQRTGDQIEHLERIDWELPSFFDSHDAPAWIRSVGDLTEFPSLDKIDRGRSIDAIVIKDLRKGIVSAAMLSWLKERYQSPKWFVSSKSWNPDWFGELRDVDLQLLLIPQVPAANAVAEGGLSCWITNGKPSNEAHKLIDDIQKQTGARIVVVLPEGSSILGSDYRSDSRGAGVLQHDPTPSHRDLDVAMASVFLPAVVANLRERPSMRIRELLSASLSFTERWMDQEMCRLSDPEGQSDHPEISLDVNAVTEHEERGSWAEIDWDRAKTNWNQAMDDIGVIATDAGKRFEIWRGMTDLEGYVCCLDSKRRVIRTILGELRRFRMGDRREHFSCIIKAPAGSGKSYMVQRLAEVSNFHPLPPFNITQMMSRASILECFDAIVSEQARLSHVPLLVFFDEINAAPWGQEVYDAFLTPLQDGEYIRGGRVIRIKPCAWVFAGTLDGQGGTSTKRSDFESRLSLEPQTFEPTAYEKRSALHLERVYLGVAILKRTFPDVRTVSEKVLRLFYSLPETCGVRDLAHFVESFFDIQHGKVRARNVPEERLRNTERLRSFHFEGGWSKRDQTADIEILGAL